MTEYGPNSKDIVINCSSFGSALESLVKALQTTPMIILKKILECRNEIASKPQVESEEDLVKSFAYEILEKFNLLPISKVLWFHLTRTWSTEEFINGILPRSLAESKISRNLINTLHKDYPNIIKILQPLLSSGNRYPYDSFKEGPCGMLVRDHAFHSAEIGNVNYLQESEFLQDLERAYKNLENAHGKKDSKGFLYLIRPRLTPCIVTFEGKMEDYDDEDYLSSIIIYLYFCTKNQYTRAICYTGEGKLIPYKNIINIEFNPLEIHDMNQRLASEV